MSECSSYGALAGHYARPVGEWDHVVYADHAHAATAQREVLRLRTAGKHCAIRLFLPNPRNGIIVNILDQLIARHNTTEEQRHALSQAFAGHIALNGRAVDECTYITAEQKKATIDLVRLAGTLLVGSESERRRITNILGVDLPTIRDTVGLPMQIDVAASKDAVVIWARGASSAVAHAFEIALADLHLPLITVDGDTETSEIPNILGRARVIIDTSNVCADDALSLAASGASLVTNSTTGAHEMLSPCTTFDEAQFESIAYATLIALGKPSSRVNVVERPVAVAVLRTNGPLVSLIVPTYNRRNLLHIALESTRRQHYENVEVIVINDAGEPVNDVVAAFPNARLINLETNGGVARACNVGFSHANGEFIGLLADDDIYFPDHLSRLMTAVLTHNADVAHGDVVSIFVRTNGEQMVAYGLDCNMIQSVTLSEILLTNRIGGTSAIFRRSLINGPLLEERIPLNRDYLLWLRLAQQTDFVHVPMPTSCYTVRPSSEKQMAQVEKHKHAAAYAFIYAEHSAEGRPLLERARTHMLSRLETDPPGLPETPPIEFSGTPWPPW